MKIACFILCCIMGGMSFTVHAQTQAEMNAEAYDAYMKADKELNAVYKLLMSKLTDQEKVDVKNVQKKWIGKKESTCKKESDGNGSMSPMILFNCLEEKTIQRTKELRNMLRGR